VICTLAEAQAFREEARGRGIQVAVANGAFDLLDVGTCATLQAAKEATGGGILIVGVNTDASVRGMKGRPVRSCRSGNGPSSSMRFVAWTGWCSSPSRPRRRCSPRSGRICT